jgi:hypothetical protein
MRKALKYGLFLSVMLISAFAVSAQIPDRIQGVVTDALSGERLIGASVIVQGTDRGTITADDGSFLIEFPVEKELRLIISYIGYQTDTVLVGPASRKAVEVELSPGLQLEEVVVSDRTGNASANYERTRMSYIDLSMEEVNNLPALLSENDVLKVIQLLPGIQSAEGAATGYYVRGGSSDQNLILLNDAVVYNPFHAAGFISIFNGDIVENISIHKSAFPAKYGGRLSSHLQVDTKEASYEKASGHAGIGMVTARLTVETPIVRDKLSMLVSGRGFYSYSLFRALAPPALKTDLPNYYFYDAFAQLNIKPTDKDRISLYYYSGKDLVAFQDKSTVDSTAFTIPWSNTAAGANWKRVLNDRTAISLSAYYSHYDFRFEALFSYGGKGLSTVIDEWGGRLNFTQAAGDHYLTYGLEANSHRIRPEVTRDEVGGANATATRVADVASYYTPKTFTAYLNDDWSVTRRFGINYGIRLPFYTGNGAFYYSIDPKVVLRYKATATGSLKASYSFGSQFLHMLVSSTATTPLDLWIASTPGVKPQRGHSVALGWYQNFAKDRLEISVEGYYKHLLNQIEYDEGVAVFSEQDIEGKLLFGRGWTAGTEFFLRKKGEKVHGFLGYTLSWAKRQFDGLNNGKAFNYKYDRRHDLTTSITYQITGNWSVSALFVIGSGQAITVPQQVIYTPSAQGAGTFVYEYGERNSFRLKPYHRMDFSVKYSGKEKRVRSHVKFDVYNLYNRRNTFFVLLDAKGSTAAGIAEPYLREYALIPVTPSLSYQMDF